MAPSPSVPTYFAKTGDMRRRYPTCLPRKNGRHAKGAVTYLRRQRNATHGTMFQIRHFSRKHHHLWINDFHALIIGCVCDGCDYSIDVEPALDMIPELIPLAVPVEHFCFLKTNLFITLISRTLCGTTTTLRQSISGAITNSKNSGIPAASPCRRSSQL